MDKANLAASRKSITDAETSVLCVVSRAKLVPSSSKRAAARYAENETKEKLSGGSSISCRTDSYAVKNTLKLPPLISPNKPSARPTIFGMKEASSTRSSIYIRAEDHTPKCKDKLPLTSYRNVPKKVPHTEQCTSFHTATTVAAATSRAQPR